MTRGIPAKQRSNNRRKQRRTGKSIHCKAVPEVDQVGITGRLCLGERSERTKGKRKNQMHRVSWHERKEDLEMMKVEIKNGRGPARFDVHSTLELLSCFDKLSRREG